MYVSAPESARPRSRTLASRPVVITGLWEAWAGPISASETLLQVG